MADEKTYSEQEIAGLLENLVDEMTGARSPGLKGLSKRMARRVERLRKVEERLAPHLGEEHPRVERLRKSATFAEDTRVTSDKIVARTEKIPKQKEYDWMVFGRVLDARHRPAPGLTVQVSDKDQKYDDLLGKAVTDADGDFQIVYPQKAGLLDRVKFPEMVLVVLDKKGKKLYSSEKGLQYRSGRSEYFEVVLGVEIKARRR